MNKGIVIFAIGHRNYYYMAENLAASLRCNGVKDIGVPVCLICDNEKKIRYPFLFDHKIEIPASLFLENDQVVFNNVTTRIYELSPYEITMKLDADMMWIYNRKIKSLFKELENAEFAVSNIGPGWGKGYSQWASEGEIRRKYGFDDSHKLYRIFGEFLYFKKNADTKKLFDAVLDVYQHPKVRCIEFANGNMTDELAMQIACMQTGIYPHENNYYPVHNHFLGLKELDRFYTYQLPENFYAYSIGGNITSKWQKSGYDNLANHYFKQLGLQAPYQVSNKNTYLPERIKN